MMSRTKFKVGDIIEVDWPGKTGTLSHTFGWTKATYYQIRRIENDGVHPATYYINTLDKQLEFCQRLEIKARDINKISRIHPSSDMLKVLFSKHE